MTRCECPHEPDVLDAVASRRWPDRLPPALAAHVVECGLCADLAEVARALRQDYEDAWAGARVPPAGLVWWRAEMRARAEAARVVSRPMLALHVAAAACALVAAALWLLIGQPRALAGLLETAQGLAALVAGSVATDAPVSARLAVALAIGTSLLVLPAALYFALKE